MSSPKLLPPASAGSAADSAFTSPRSKKRVRQDSSESSGSSGSESGTSGSGYAIALRSIRRQIEALKRDEEARYLGAMAHLDALDDAITDIVKGKNRDRRSKKKRRKERSATLGEVAFKKNITQAGERNTSSREAAVVRDQSIPHSGQVVHGQASDSVATPSSPSGLDVETTHPPDDDFSAETQDEVDQVLSDGSTTARMPVDGHIHRPSSSDRQGLIKTESGGHEVPWVTHEENATESMAFEEKKAKIYFIRHRVQKVLMSTPDEAPDEVVLSQIGKHFASLEEFAHIEEEIFQQSKIHKVMRGIDSLPFVPGDNKYRFKCRAHALLLRWGKLVAPDREAPLTRGSITAPPTTRRERPSNSFAQSTLYRTETLHVARSLRDTLSSQPAHVQKADLLQAKARLHELLEDEEMTEDEASNSIQYHLSTLESIVNPDTELIKAININDVLKAIIRQPSVPREAEFHFKRRASTILNNWNKILREESTVLKPRAVKQDDSDTPARNTDPPGSPAIAGSVLEVVDRPLRDPAETAKLKWLWEAVSYLNIVRSEYLSNPRAHSAIVGILEDYKNGTIEPSLLIKKCLHIFSGPPPMCVGGFKAKTTLPSPLVSQKGIESGTAVAEALPFVQPKSNITADPRSLSTPQWQEVHDLALTHRSNNPLPDPRTPTQTKLPEPWSAPVATMVLHTSDMPHAFMSEKARGKQRMVVAEDDALDTVIAGHESPSRQKLGRDITQLSPLNRGVSPTTEEEIYKQLEADEALAKSLALAWGSPQAHERHDEEVARNLQEKYNTETYDSENDTNIPSRAPDPSNAPHPEGGGQGRDSGVNKARATLTQDTEMVDAPHAPEKRYDEEGNRGHSSHDDVEMSGVESGPYAGSQNNGQTLPALLNPPPVVQDGLATQDHPGQPLPYHGEGETMTTRPEESDDELLITSVGPVQTKITDWDSPPHERKKRQSQPRLPRQQNPTSLPTEDTNADTVTRLQATVPTISDDSSDDDPPRKSVRCPRAQVEDAGSSSFGPSVRSRFKRQRPPHYGDTSSRGEEGDEGEPANNSHPETSKIGTRDERASSHTASPTPVYASPTPSRPKMASRVAKIKEERTQNAKRIKDHDSSRATTAVRQPQNALIAPAAASATAAAVAAKSAILALNTSDLLKSLNNRFPLDRSNAPDNPTSFSRKGISHVIGPSNMKTFVPLKPDAANAYQTPKAVFLKRNLNPFCPPVAMTHGVMYTMRMHTMRKYEWKEGEVALLFCHRQGSDWEYVGNYKLESWSVMMRDEWSSMPDRFKRQWAKSIKEKSNSKDGWSSHLLGEVGFLEEPRQEFSWEDVMGLFTKDGEPKLRAWRGLMRCVGFDE
ncbi:MAG: hypothetical protein M1839_006163, partial [Geoglossum umbratile]